MKKEFNLSENKSTFEDDDKNITHWYREDFIKEFIKRILEEELEGKDLFIKIRKLAGDELII